MPEFSKFDMNRLWSAYSTDGAATLSLSSHNGTASFVVFKRNSETRKPVVKWNLSLAAMMAVANVLKALETAAPETRSAISQTLYDRESRSIKLVSSFVFVKNEKKGFDIEITGKSVANPIRFPIRCASTFTTTNEPLTDEQKALNGVRELEFLMTTQLPMANLLSRLNMERPQHSNNNNHGHSNYNSNGGNQHGGSSDLFNDSNSDSVFGA